jgi:creatinine amidohydrolase
MNWPAVAALPKSTPVVIPIAALEQHGHHMPVFTDSILLGEVMRRVSEQLAERVLFTPLMWWGNSDHHMDFAGTMSASPRLYLDLLANLVDNMLTHGFQRILLINGHGGNHVPGQQAVFELRQKHRQRNDLLLLLATYWLLGGKPHEQGLAMEQTRMGHACEWETSMMLRIRPDLVGDLKKTERVEWGMPFEPGSRGWITKERTPTGHIGYPTNASAEKGEILFRTFTADVIAYVNRMIAWDGQSWSG